MYRQDQLSFSRLKMFDETRTNRYATSFNKTFWPKAFLRWIGHDSWAAVQN